MARLRALLALAAGLIVLLPMLAALPATATAAAPAAPQAPRFAVHPPPLSRALFPALEAARLHALRVLAGGRSLYVDTSAGTHVHVLVFESRSSEGLLPPIVLLHGVCSTAHDYAPLVRRLRRRHRSVIVLDLPGHGQSPVPPGDPDLDTLVTSAVEAVQQALALLDGPHHNAQGAPATRKVILFGNSLGGLVGCRVALAMPERVAGLCLASPAGAPMTPADLAGVKTLFQLDSHLKGLAFLHRVTAFPDRLPGVITHLMAWCCRARVSTGPIAHIMTKAEARHMLTRGDLRRLKDIPTLLIWGKHERVFNDRHRSFFLKHLPRRSSALHTEEEFGHVPFLDDPDRLVELLDAFVRQRCMG